jgi:hypothetical protein
MSVTSGNLPEDSGYNSTQQYFNNFYLQQPVVGPAENDAVIAYFQMITGDKETGKTFLFQKFKGGNQAFIFKRKRPKCNTLIQITSNDSK